MCSALWFRVIGAKPVSGMQACVQLQAGRRAEGAFISVRSRQGGNKCKAAKGQR